MRTLTVILLFFAISPAISNAEQYNRGGQVVHTRLAPVVAHRVLPPYRGMHVYEGRTLRR